MPLPHRTSPLEAYCPRQICAKVLPPPPPRRRQRASVSPTSPSLARRPPYPLLVLAPPDLRYRSQPITGKSRAASATLTVVTTARAPCAAPTWAGLAAFGCGQGRRAPACTAMPPTVRHRSWAHERRCRRPNNGPTLFLDFHFSKNIYPFKYFRNSFKLSKFIAIHRKFIKTQNKFCLDPLE
jgi:hypothetical protein